MGRWLWMTGGLVVWALQFSALYAFSSLADVVSTADAFPWRMAGLAISILSLVTCGLLLRRALHKCSASEQNFVHEIAALSAALGLVAVTWQGFPVLLGH